MGKTAWSLGSVQPEQSHPLLSPSQWPRQKMQEKSRGPAQWGGFEPLGPLHSQMFFGSSSGDGSATAGSTCSWREANHWTSTTKAASSLGPRTSPAARLTGKEFSPKGSARLSGRQKGRGRMN